MQLLLSRLRRILRTGVVYFAATGGGAKLIDWFVANFHVKKNDRGNCISPFIRRRRAPSCQILAYHRVNDENDCFFPAISTRHFAGQMEILADRFTVCSLDRIVEGIQSGDLPANAIAVTFDDGYRDNYVNAFPILSQYSIPATIFLATGAIDGDILWHDRLFSLFRKTKVGHMDGFDSRLDKLPLITVEEKLEAQRRVLDMLWSMNDQERKASIQRLSRCLNVSADSEFDGLMMTWGEVVEMHRNGIDFGAHTVNHPILSRLPESSAAREITDSVKTIENKLGTQVRSFAYPVGRKIDFDFTTKILVREAGPGCGVSMILGNNEAGADLYELRRIAPWGESAEAFALRLNYHRFAS